MNTLIVKLHCFLLNCNKQNLLFICKKIFSYAKIVVLFIILWTIFSGNDKPLMIACGVVSVVFTFIVCISGNIISIHSYIIKLTFFKYVYVLLRDVIVSSLQMVKIIYSDKININPGTIIMNVSKLTDQEKVLFSNLITMTPGTFVIAVNGDDFLIHALNKNDLEFKDNKAIKNLLKKMRGEDEK